ncbi:MAG: hypothetical protein ABR579_04410, partial [Actinomycetota bacterium]
MPFRRVISLFIALAAVASVTAILASAPSHADPATKSTGAAYGDNENAQNAKAPEVKAVAPPPNDVFQQKTLVDSPLASHAHVEAGACIQAGNEAQLQDIMDGASKAARPSPTTTATPTDTATPTQTATPTDTASPTQTVTPTPTETTSPLPAGKQLALAPPGYPTSDRCLTPAGTSASASTPTCVDIETGAADPAPKCVTNTPLWNARGYAKAFDIGMGSAHEAESEAVGRCVGNNPQYETAARGDFSGSAVPDSTQPNQPIDLGIGGGAVVTFWETNWDPRTDQTTDGSNTVFVNAIHIVTPTENIIFG